MLRRLRSWNLPEEVRSGGSCVMDSLIAWPLTLLLGCWPSCLLSLLPWSNSGLIDSVSRSSADGMSENGGTLSGGAATSVLAQRSSDVDEVADPVEAWRDLFDDFFRGLFAVPVC